MKVAVAMPRIIGVAVDGSDQSLRAVNYAIQLALLNVSRIVSVPVILPSFSGSTLSSRRE